MIRDIRTEELCLELFADFHRHQQVTKCWRKRDGGWMLVDNPFVEEWSREQYAFLVQCLKDTLASGGAVYGAFENGALKGFAAVLPEFFGSRGQYLELASLHVSEECRGRGLGRALMNAAMAWARAQGAEKLYISAHSAMESQAFYRAMGCREAEEYNQSRVEQEPFDCQLEAAL